MHIGVIHKGDGFTALVLAADNDPLRELWQRILLCLPAPFLRCERHLPIYFSDLGFGGEACCAMLSVAYGFGFDVVQIVDVCKERHATQHAKHDRRNNDQSCKVGHRISSCCENKRPSFQSFWIGTRISLGIPCSFNFSAIRLAAACPGSS